MPKQPTIAEFEKLSYTICPREAGQVVEVSYALWADGAGGGLVVRRTYDRSCEDVSYATAPVGDQFEPWNGVVDSDGPFLPLPAVEPPKAVPCTIRVETAPGISASAIGERYGSLGAVWRDAVDRCDSEGCGRVFLDCPDEETAEHIGGQMESDPDVTCYEFL